MQVSEVSAVPVHRKGIDMGINVRQCAPSTVELDLTKLICVIFKCIQQTPLVHIKPRDHKPAGVRGCRH